MDVAARPPAREKIFEKNIKKRLTSLLAPVSMVTGEGIRQGLLQLNKGRDRPKA